MWNPVMCLHFITQSLLPSCAGSTGLKHGLKTSYVSQGFRMSCVCVRLHRSLYTVVDSDDDGWFSWLKSALYAYCLLQRNSKVFCSQIKFQIVKNPVWQYWHTLAKVGYPRGQINSLPSTVLTKTFINSLSFVRLWSALVQMLPRTSHHLCATISFLLCAEAFEQPQCFGHWNYFLWGLGYPLRPRLCIMTW